MTEHFRLEKPLWTMDDFGVMGWHDSRVWAMVAEEEKFEFAMDLDYIFKWVHPGPGETYFQFWVAPVTMVFENAYDVAIAIESSQGGIEVADLHREDSQLTPNGALKDYRFRFECQEGEISLRASGYRLYVRSEPSLMQGQRFSIEERGGISVERRAVAV
jgi:hypothetical protein